MIVRQFISWVRTASAEERAEATRALARAWIISDLSDEERIAAEGALLMLLDDSSPLVRQALSDIFAASTAAPPALIASLAADQPSIALPVLEFSPLLPDSDLVDLVATGSEEMQCAIARRFRLSAAVSAAIAEVGGAPAILELIENPGVVLAPFSFDRIAERHGDLAAVREALLRHDHLPMQTRAELVAKTSIALARFVAARDWMSPQRADRVAAEAVERSLVDMASASVDGQLTPLVRHLRDSGQLNAALLLRSLLSGRTGLLEAALTELTELPRSRVAAIVRHGGGAGVNALLTRAGFPASVLPAFRFALRALAQFGPLEVVGEPPRLDRYLVDHVLQACESDSAVDEPLLVLLRRFAVEAAREEARALCSDVASDIDAMTFVESFEAQFALIETASFEDYTEFDDTWAEVNDNQAPIIGAYEPSLDGYEDVFDEGYAALNDDDLDGDDYEAFGLYDAERANASDKLIAA